MAPKKITDFTGFRTSIRLLFEVDVYKRQILYGGREVILPENLKERDTTEVLTALGLDKKTIAMQKMRDIFKNASIKYTGKSYVVLIGVENQSDIHLSLIHICGGDSR